MHISAEVDDTDILREAFEIFYKRLSFDEFTNVAKEIFKSKETTLKDYLGLTIAHFNDDRFISLMEFAVENESNKELKKDQQMVVDQLKWG